MPAEPLIEAAVEESIVCTVHQQTRPLTEHTQVSLEELGRYGSVGKYSLRQCRSKLTLCPDSLLSGDIAQVAVAAATDAIVAGEVVSFPSKP